jgi:NAD+ synthase (glutamine-hydrolysing)
LAQLNATVGDIAGNVSGIRGFIRRADKHNCDAIIFPEMSICGYPPEDLLLKKHFLEDNRKAIDQLATETGEMIVVAGFAEPDRGGSYNSLAVMQNGSVNNVYRKNVLPNYGVFDEKRYFQPGGEPLVIDIRGLRVALTICEDIWRIERLDKFLRGEHPPDVIINISASPFHLGKIGIRQETLGRCAKHFGCVVGYCNLVGGQDELVFDGRSMFVDSEGKVTSQAEAFAEDILVVDIDIPKDGPAGVRNIKAALEYPDPQSMDVVGEVYEALVVGTADYVRKNGFSKVLIGLSGGVDSSLTAAIAVDALGAENVVGITMPSRFNAAETRSDAEKTAENLGMQFHTIGIENVLGSFNETLGAMDGWDDKGVAYENLQARIRGTILMSLSNQTSHMVLTTGNKSETAVGYSTLYGDTAGGFAVIKDVPKTMVYELSRYVNKMHGREIVPVSVIERPPSAELRADQKDSDSLPDYDLLDKILKGCIEEDKSAQQLIEAGLDEDTVKRISALVDRNEYKRRQSPPGVKITPKAFGKDRRMPITNRYISR